MLDKSNVYLDTFSFSTTNLTQIQISFLLPLPMQVRTHYNRILSSFLAIHPKQTLCHFLFFFYVVIIKANLSYKFTWNGSVRTGEVSGCSVRNSAK